MSNWLLVISRDTELTRALTRTLSRDGGANQLWAVDSPERARRALAEREFLPLAIVIDELFLREEPLAAVAEEFAWCAPLILIVRPEHQAQLASIVAEGKADVASRCDYFIPLANALVERALRWEREVEKQTERLESLPIERDSTGGSEPDEGGFPAQAVRIVGTILDNLELTLSERSRLPVTIARRLERLADLSFDLKYGLRLLAGNTDGEKAARSETANRD